MVFEIGVKNIQAKAYNGARTVYEGIALLKGGGRSKKLGGNIVI